MQSLSQIISRLEKVESIVKPFTFFNVKEVSFGASNTGENAWVYTTSANDGRRNQIVLPKVG